MMNKLIVIGRVGQQPEVKTFDNGNSVANFSLASSEKYKDKNGQQQENTEWFNCTVNGGLVGVVQQYVNKGDLLYIEAVSQTREYTDNQGQKKKATNWIVRQLKMLGSKSDNQGQGAGAPQNNPFGQQQQQQNPFQPGGQQPPPQQTQQHFGQPGQQGYPPQQTMAQGQQQGQQQGFGPQTGGWDPNRPF